MPEELYHIPTAFKTNANANVVRAVPEALAWHEDWTDAAQALVGSRVRVVDVHPTRGFQVEKRGMVRAWMPSCALEAPAKDGVVVFIPSEGT